MHKCLSVTISRIFYVSSASYYYFIIPSQIFAKFMTKDLHQQQEENPLRLFLKGFASTNKQKTTFAMQLMEERGRKESFPLLYGNNEQVFVLTPWKTNVVFLYYKLIPNPVIISVYPRLWSRIVININSAFL